MTAAPRHRDDHPVGPPGGRISRQERSEPASHHVMPSFINNLPFDCADALRVARSWAAARAYVFCVEAGPEDGHEASGR